jgi:dTDP-glucose pyrophosphorylase
MKDWNRLSVRPEALIKDVINVLNETAMQVVLVTGQNSELLGTITDGDIRRGFLKGIGLDGKAESIMNKKPKCAGPADSIEKNRKLMQKFHLRHLPVLDENQKMVNLQILDETNDPKIRNNKVVLMAGGLGTRLSPLTDDCPKPLLSVGSGKPMLELIMENTLRFGLKNISISVNYKAEMIESHFGDGSKWGASIDYIREKAQLGTAGALGLISDRPTHPLIVMNGDVLTKVNLDQLLDFHQEQKATLTMGIREYDFQVPFGVVTLKDNHVKAIEEKPVHKFFVNAGIYIINPEVLDHIPKNQHLDMPDLVDILIKNDERVAAFPLREYWIDVGHHSDLEKAQDDFVGEFS